MTGSTLGAAWRRGQDGWPRSFPLAQFPNAPLLIALVASVVGWVTHGRVHAYASAVFYMGLTVWAYEEALRGVNWFRHVVGIGALVYVVVRLANALNG